MRELLEDAGPRAGRRARRRVEVEEFEEDDGTIVLELSVAEDDYGKVIGRGGRTANALRTVVKAAAVEGEPPRARRHRRLTWPRARRLARGGPRRPPARARRLFHVTRPRAALLRARRARRASAARDGGDRPPRGHRRAPDRCASAGADSREAVEALRGAELLVPARRRARRSSEDEWWRRGSRGLRGRRRRRAGRARRAAAWRCPSCEVLEVERDGGGRAARAAGARRASRSVDVEPRARSTSTSRSSGEDATERMQIDVVTLFPEWFDWFRGQRHVAQRARARATSCARSTRATTRRSAAARSTTRRSAAAPGWCCASTSWTPRCAASTASTRSTCATSAA